MLAVRQSGEVIGEMSLLESAPRYATVRARTDCILLVIEHQHLDHLLNTSPSAARAMLHTITARQRSSQMIIRQSEKMAQLGTMTAGIAHELNNTRGSYWARRRSIKEALNRWKEFNSSLNQRSLLESQQKIIQTLDELAKERARQPIDLNPLDRGDQEERFENWLEQHAIEAGSGIRPAAGQPGVYNP